MSTEINLILIAIAIILAASRVAFSQVKKRDRQNGLHLADRYYTLFGTLQLLFLSEEKRMKKEQEKPFEDQARDDKALKKKVMIMAAAYIGIAVLSSLLLYVRNGLVTVILSNISMIVIAISYMLSKSRILAIFVLIYGIVTGISAAVTGLPAQLIMAAASIAFFVYDAVLRKQNKEKK